MFQTGTRKRAKTTNVAWFGRQACLTTQHSVYGAECKLLPTLDFTRFGKLQLKRDSQFLLLWVPLNLPSVESPLCRCLVWSPSQDGDPPVPGGSAVAAVRPWKRRSPPAEEKSSAPRWRGARARDGPGEGREKTGRRGGERERESDGLVTKSNGLQPSRESRSMMFSPRFC